MNALVALYVLLTVFEGATSWQFKKIQETHRYALSGFESRISNQDSKLGLYLTLLLFVVRFGGIGFLFFLGFKTIWYYPIFLYFFSLAVTTVTTLILRTKINSGITLVTIVSTVTMPVLFVLIWVILFNY